MLVVQNMAELIGQTRKNFYGYLKADHSYYRKIGFHLIYRSL
jgi:hypothetical protein